MTVTASTQPPADETTATSPDLITRAASVVPLLCQNAKATEENRRVVEENIEAIKEAGLFRLAVPRRFGGHQANFQTFLQVSAEMARGDTFTVNAMQYLYLARKR